MDDDWQTREIEDALKEADRGEFASEEEVKRVIEKWTGSKVAPKSKQDKGFQG
jgi:predicted transcriptional regulator